jgi:ATP-dependent Clp endopeptidase proteolytic subunit ClpP
MGDVTLLNGNTIYFNCYVEKYTVDRAISLLKQVNHHIAKVEIEHPELKGSLRPKFIINSNGGSVVQGLRLFDRLKNNIYDVSTIVDGMSASMGIILAVAGKKKQATPNSVLMIHALSAGAQGKFRELMDYAKFWQQLQTKLGNILVENTKAKKEDIDEFMKGETYIMAEEALKLGLIDEIVHL